MLFSILALLKHTGDILDENIAASCRQVALLI